MKAATAYKRRDGWYFHADSTTTVGVGVASPPYIKRDRKASSDALGQAVLETLNGAEQAVPHPSTTQWDKVFGAILDLAGVKTWAAFASHASSASLCSDDDWLTIEPATNEGAKMGFVPIPGVSVKIPADASPSEIGEALKKAMELCGPE